MATKYIEFSLKDGEREISFKLNGSGFTFEQLVEHFKEFSLSMGYHPETINRYFEED